MFSLLSGCSIQLLLFRPSPHSPTTVCVTQICLWQIGFQYTHGSTSRVWPVGVGLVVLGPPSHRYDVWRKIRQNAKTKQQVDVRKVSTMHFKGKRINDYVLEVCCDDDVWTSNKYEQLGFYRVWSSKFENQLWFCDLGFQMVPYDPSCMLPDVPRCS